MEQQKVPLKTTLYLPKHCQNIRNHTKYLGKGTVISADFSCGEDEPSSLMSETNSSGIVTGSEHFMEQAEAIAQRDSEDKDTKVKIIYICL